MIISDIKLDLNFYNVQFLFFFEKLHKTKQLKINLLVCFHMCVGKVSQIIRFILACPITLSTKIRRLAMYLVGAIDSMMDCVSKVNPIRTRFLLKPVYWTSSAFVTMKNERFELSVCVEMVVANFKTDLIWKINNN